MTCTASACRYTLVPELRRKPCRRLVASIASRIGGNMILRLGFCRKPVTGRVANRTLGRCASEEATDVAGITARTQMGTGQIETSLDMIEAHLLGLWAFFRRDRATDRDDQHDGRAEDRHDDRLHSGR